MHIIYEHIRQLLTLPSDRPYKLATEVYKEKLRWQW